MNKVVSYHFDAFPNLQRAAKEPIEDLLEQEYEKALERIQSQFKMERIVYSQDGLYSRQLETVKQKPEPAKTYYNSRGQLISRTVSADVREMAQHLNAYFMVCNH